MGIARLLPRGFVQNLAETHPQLTQLRARLVRDLRVDPARAGRLIASLVEHAANDLGDAFLGQMGARLRRIDSIRARIGAAIDHVLAEGALPADLDRQAISGLFDDLQREMSQLRSLRTFAETHSPDANIESILRGIGPTQEAGPGLRPFAHAADPLQGVVGPVPARMPREAMAAMERDNPARAALFRSVMEEHGDALGLAVLANTESAQQAALHRLRGPLGPSFPHDELAEAVRELGRARWRELHGPGTEAARARAHVRAQRIADLPDELRAVIGNDNTVLGPLAEQHPAGLHELWDAWVAGGRRSDFRAYVYGEMRSGVRPALAEWQAAHDLANQHGVALLRDPASFDPAQPNLRRVNPREGGTDLVGLRPDGEIWYVDDKSHRLSANQRRSGQRGLNVSGVSAFEGRRLIVNMFEDVAEMEAGFARIAAEGRVPDPRAVEAAGRIRRAAEALDRESAGWSEADFDLPANRQRIDAILAAPEHRIRLRVSSTMGDVTGVSAALRDLGIDVLPPVGAVP